MKRSCEITGKLSRDSQPSSPTSSEIPHDLVSLLCTGREGQTAGWISPLQPSPSPPKVVISDRSLSVSSGEDHTMFADSSGGGLFTQPPLTSRTKVEEGETQQQQQSILEFYLWLWLPPQRKNLLNQQRCKSNNSSELVSKLTSSTPPPLASPGLIWGELPILSKPWFAPLKIETKPVLRRYSED